MPTVVWPGTPGEKFTNDGQTILYQLICSWSNTCGTCAQFHLAIAKWWGKFHTGCLLPGSTISADSIRAAFVARYHGDAYRITFRDGSTTSVTANHMLLTPDGFLKAESLVQGDEVIQCPMFQGVICDGPYEYRSPAPIEEVVRSLTMRPGMAARSVPATPEDLHGDGSFCYGDVHVITADRQLLYDFDSSVREPSTKLFLNRTDGNLKPLTTDGNPFSVLLALRDATDGGMGSLREAKASILAESVKANRGGLASASDPDSGLAENLSDRVTAASGPRRDAEFTLPGSVAGDDPGRIREVQRQFPGKVGTTAIACIERMHYSGPIYDVQTTSSLYLVGNGIASSNCNCRSEPVYPGKTSLPYEDWREIAKSLSPQQHKALVGVSNAKLIDAGVVKWDDVVTPTRIRPLREVTSRSKLTVEQMTKAGVKKDIAERAHQSVNTPEHVLAQQHRQQLIQQIQALGVPPKTITDMLAQGLAGRIGLGTGVPGSGPQSMPRTGPTREGWIRKVMGMLTGLFRRTRASMQPKTNKP